MVKRDEETKIWEDEGVVSQRWDRDNLVRRLRYWYGSCLIWLLPTGRVLVPPMDYRSRNGFLYD